MNKSLFLFLFFVFHVFDICAQELMVKSFKLAENDISAQTQPRKDLNDRNCALVKVLYVGEIVDVEGNVVKPIVKRSNEFWIYMPQNSRQIKIVARNYIPMMITFEDYGIEKLESNKTYVLTIVKPHDSYETVDAGGNFYAISVLPRNAVVTIDGIQQNVSSDGEYSAMLPYGTHTYKVEAGGYISKSGSFSVSGGDMTPINVSLVSVMATVSVTCPTPAVSLYVDKKLVGNAPWSGSLKEGMHLVEAKKNGYRSQQKTIQLSQQQKLDVSFGELIAIQGNLSVNYKPFGADVYVDGKRMGQSPRVFNGLLIGNHLVEVRKEGYTTDEKNIMISEGQTASISGTLSSNTVSLSNGSGHSTSSSVFTSGTVYDVVEEMPSFPGGAAAMMSYISSNIKYPQSAREALIMGRVIVSFIVEKDGSISDAKVVRNVDADLDREALRVVKSMPKWKPGKNKGSVVRVKFTVPVVFRLD